MDKNQLTTVILKGSFGALPVVGPMMSEIIGTLIPDFRFERLEEMVKTLDEKLAQMDPEILNQRAKTPEGVDLLEDGFHMAARALSQERIDYLASLIKNGLTDEELGHIEYKRMAALLGELNDLEILILKSESFMDRGTDKQLDFMEKHEEALLSPSAGLGPEQDHIDKCVIFKSHQAHLVRLNLLSSEYTLTGNRSKTGMRLVGGNNITPLGRLLLRSIDQDDLELREE